MKRRDLLLLRPNRDRIVELPCGRLYMRYREALAGSARRAGPPAPLEDDPRCGEPPLELTIPTPEALFVALDRELNGVRVVRLLDVGWLSEPGFRRELDRVLDAFRARGGRVEMPDDV